MTLKNVQLKIGDLVIHYSDSTEITIDGVSYLVSLLSLRYHKRMFEPSWIDASIQVVENSVNGEKNVPGRDEFTILLSGKTVTLSDDTVTVAKDYYVYKALPVYRRSSDGRYVYISLQIYSPDHKLTLDNYCKTYVNCKLSADIMAGALKEGTTDADKGILARAGFTADTVDYTNNLHFLEYLVSDEKNKIAKREFIQPYLVQYNESFYDLIARTANRCGEFFYYEDGILRLGLKEPTSSDEIKNINPDKALTASYDDSTCSTLLFQNSPQERVYVNGMGVSAGEYAKNDYALNDEVPVDEYLINTVTKDSFGDVFKLTCKTWTNLLLDCGNAVLRSSSWTSMVAQLGTKYLDLYTTAVSLAKQLNAKGNDEYIKTEDGDKKNLHASEQYDKSTDSVTLYGSLLTNEVKEKNYSFQQNLNASFYQFIHRGCREVSEHIVSLNLGANEVTHLLGDTVTLSTSGKSDSTPLPRYIVVEVDEVIKSEDQNANKEDWLIGERLVLSPLFYASVKKGEDTEDNKNAEVSLELAIPPIILPPVKSAGPQLAYVAENEDPLGFGRVCIRYPWQRETDPSSPWIRMMVPFAPHDTEDNGGGMYFQPSEGDEVMVDYENGNIERPYVLGSFFTNRTKSPKKRLTSRAPQGERTIASKKGHSIQFDDGDTLSDFMGAVVPALGLVQKYARYVDTGNLEWGADSSLSGGMTLTDRWGFYKISASTTERTINISCPFGEVGINAFTGITISAPNGDISIKGKNVSIEAGNEVKIVSGKFIDEKKTAADILSSAASAAVDNLVGTYLAPVTDFSLLRTFADILVKPISGTLSVKSGRYMLLMAGAGNASIPNKGYSVKGLRKMEEENVDKRKFINTISYVNTRVDAWVNQIWSVYSLIQASANSYDANPKKTSPDRAGMLDIIFSEENALTANDNRFTFANNATDVEKNTIIQTVNDARLNAYLLMRYCKGIRDGENNIVDDEKCFVAEVKKYLKDSVPELITDIINKTARFDKDENTVKGCAKVFKRKLIEKIIGKVNVVEQNPEKKTDVVTFTDDNSYADNEKWGKYCSNLAKYTGASKGLLSQVLSAAGDAFKDAMTDNLNPLSGWSENAVWDTCKQGEILFSDKSGKTTVSMVNGALSSSPNNDELIDQIKEILKNN